jgi:ABC-type Mn2+/Zn2+ transport system ATPase subunit
VSVNPLGDPRRLLAPRPIALRVRDLRAGYRGVLALDGVSFDLPAGSLTALIGPNGAGKSTLFQALLGLLPLRGGQIEVGAGYLRGGARPFGYLPQSSALDLDFPVTVRDVVAMGRYARLGPVRRPTAHDWAVVDACLRQVGLAEFGERHISELSGGQRQRVLLARALAQEAPILLLDEPVSGVDTLSQQAVMAVLAELAARGTTILMATHDLALVSQRFDHVVCLNRRVIAQGPPEAVLTESVLNQTYHTRMVLVRVEGKLYALDTGSDD